MDYFPDFHEIKPDAILSYDHLNVDVCMVPPPPLSPSSQLDEQPGSFSLLFITWDNAWLIISSHACILLIREEPWRWLKKTMSDEISNDPHA